MSVSESESLTPENIFELLSNHRRRMVLYILRTDAGTVDVRELAEEIAAMENEVEVDELTSQQRKRVYVSLYQTHLPKMAQMNAIDYDKDDGTVRITDQTTNIDRYLTNGEQTTYPWGFHYGALTAVSATLLGLALLGAPLFDVVSLPWLGLGLLTAFALSAVVQIVMRTRDSPIPFELGQYDR